MRASLRILAAAAALTAFALSGCGGSSKSTKTAVDLQSDPALMGSLPGGGLVYGQVDLARLRTSEHVQRIVGWYHELLPAIPGVDEENVHIAHVEELLARTDALALSVYLDNELGVERPGAVEDGAVLLLRASIDVDWIEAWAAEAGQSFDKRIEAGRTILTPAGVSKNELAIIELAPGLFGVVVGPEEGVVPRVRALRARVESGALELDDPELAQLAEAAGVTAAPFGLVARVPVEFAEKLGRQLAKTGKASNYSPEDLAEIRAAAVTFDPSGTLLGETVIRTETPEAATRLAGSIEAETRSHADNRWFILAGIDLWLDRTETAADEHLVRSTTRLSVEEMRMWLFHVERLVLFGKTFLDGGLGELLGGFTAAAAAGGEGGMAVPMEATPSHPEEAPVEQVGPEEKYDAPVEETPPPKDGGPASKR